MRNRALIALMTAGLFGPILPAAAQGRGQPVQLPDGAGKELVQATCARCHGLDNISNSSGNTRDGWRELFSSMVALPKDQADVISSYLAEHFPTKPAPQAVLILGPAVVSFKEWELPTLGQRPHDPLAARDGSIWWTGMFANVLGRLDPKTGQMKEFPVKTPQSGPHGLVEDKGGNIWFTANQSTYVGKLDPKTGQVTEYPLPQGVRGPHTPIFDQRGTLFFTLQSGHVGRIIPATGEMKVVATPSTGTYPYGIQVNSKGVPWYVDFRGNRIGSIDPVTMTITEHTLPSADARPRRLALTPDDVVWYTDFARGYLGRFDPATGAVKEWPSPGGPKRPLVQRILGEAEYARALRPQDGKVPDLDHSGGWRCRAQHDARGERQPRAGRERPQPGRARRNQESGRIEMTVPAFYRRRRRARRADPHSIVFLAT
jgi:virginiamycin B lyase